MLEWPKKTPESIALVTAFLRTQANDSWIVGGCVRDALLGRSIDDVDVTAQGAAKLGQAFAEVTKSRCIPLHDDPATVAVVDRETGARVDFAELRASSIEGDLRARDYTVNAMAVSVREEGAIQPLDPCNGLADLRAGQLRLVSERALTEDPLRLLRAFRLAAQLGFSIHDGTLGAIQDRAELAGAPSGERIGDEIGRMFAVGPGVDLLRKFTESGVAAAVVHPCRINTEAQMTAYGRTRAHVAEIMASAPGLRALLELVHSRRLQPWLFFSCWLGPQAPGDARALSDSLRLSRVQRAALLAYTNDETQPVGADRRRASELWTELSEHSLGRAIRSAAWDFGPGDVWGPVVEAIATNVYPESRRRMLVSGTDLMAEFGVHGPALGRVLALLRAGQLSGELRTVEQAMRAAHKMVGQPDGTPYATQ